MLARHRAHILASALLVLPQGHQVLDLLKRKTQRPAAVNKLQHLHIARAVDAVAGVGALRRANQADRLVVANHLGRYARRRRGFTDIHALAFGRQRVSSSALATTDTLDKAIAAPASMGLSRPKAASGTPTRLKINAQNRFWRILL